MKKYLTPSMEIKGFAAENVVTASGPDAVEQWNTDNGYNAATVNWKNLNTAGINVVF